MTDQNADLITEAEERLQIALDAQRWLAAGEYENAVMAVIRSDDVQFYRNMLTALRAAEAREKVLREALATIHEAAFTHKGYPTPQSELVEAAARRALGGEP